MLTHNTHGCTSRLHKLIYFKGPKYTLITYYLSFSPKRTVFTDTLKRKLLQENFRKHTSFGEVCLLIFVDTLLSSVLSSIYIPKKKKKKEGGANL